MNAGTWRTMLDTVTKAIGKTKTRRYSNSYGRKPIMVEISPGGVLVVARRSADGANRPDCEAEFWTNGLVRERARPICVDSQFLIGMLRGLPKGADVSAESKGERLIISAADHNLSAALPDIKDRGISDVAISSDGFGWGGVGELDATSLESLKWVARACATDKTRPTLGGVQLKSDGARSIRAAATDTHRLHVTDIPYDADHEFSALVSAEWLLSIIALAKKLKPMSTGWMAAENWMRCVMDIPNIGRARFTTRVIEGAFPDYKKVIPKRSKGRAVVGSNDLRGALAATKPIWQNEANRVGVAYHDDALHISAEDGETDGLGATVNVPCKQEGAEVIRMHLNARYLTDAIHGDGKVRIRNTGPLDQVAIDSEKHLAVVMPMQK